MLGKEIIHTHFPKLFIHFLILRVFLNFMCVPVCNDHLSSIIQSPRDHLKYSDYQWQVNAEKSLGLFANTLCAVHFNTIFDWQQAKQTFKEQQAVCDTADFTNQPFKSHSCSPSWAFFQLLLSFQLSFAFSFFPPFLPLFFLPQSLSSYFIWSLFSILLLSPSSFPHSFLLFLSKAQTN